MAASPISERFSYRDVADPSYTVPRVCSSHEARKSWLPATLHLDSASLPQVSTDYIAILDLKDNSYKRVKLLGLPADADGIYVHAIDVVVDSKSGKKTVFINSHRPPKNRSLGKTLGANSVIEIFETTGNDYELKHVKTVSHPLIRTPNNLVATGPRTFFASNDHRHKVHWVSCNFMCSLIEVIAVRARDCVPGTVCLNGFAFSEISRRED